MSPQYVIETTMLRPDGRIEKFHRTVQVPNFSVLSPLVGTPLLALTPMSSVPVLCMVMSVTPELVILRRCDDQTIDPITLLTGK